MPLIQLRYTFYIFIILVEISRGELKFLSLLSGNYMCSFRYFENGKGWIKEVNTC